MSEDFQEAIAEVKAAHKLEASKAQKVVARLTSIQRSQKAGREITRKQKVQLTEANDELTEAENKAGLSLIKFANDFLE